MGTCSDVGLVIKKSAYQKYVDWFADNEIDSDNYHVPSDAQIFEKEDCVLLVWEDVTNFGLEAPIAKALESIEETDYRLVEACAEYAADAISQGELEDDPFSLEQEVSVVLRYYV